MKQIIYFFLLLITVSFTACKKNKTLEALSDTEFIDYISTEDYRESITRIDSLAKINTYSAYKTGLLYYEKGKILGTLEKDIEAIASLTKALNLFEKGENQEYIAKTNMLLSDSNAFLSKNDIAVSHINVALKIFKETKDKKGEAKALNSLAHIEFQKNNFEKSITYVKQATVIQEELKDMVTLSASYNNIGYILEQTKNFDEAKIYYEKAIKLNKKLNRLNSSPLRNLGYVYLLDNELEKCKLLYFEALKIEEQAGVLSIQKEIYDVLLELSIKEKSFENSSLYIAKRDSLNQLIIKFENEEKIKLIEGQYNLIAKETELKQQRIDSQKNNIIVAKIGRAHV